VQIALDYLTFLGKVTDMFQEFTDHLGHLKVYAKRCNQTRIVEEVRRIHYTRNLLMITQAVVAIYGDLLDFCRKARLVFFNPDGTCRSCTTSEHCKPLLNQFTPGYRSIRLFIRVQWEPFEVGFGTIKSNLNQHLNVLLHAAQADLLAGAHDQTKVYEGALPLHILTRRLLTTF